MALYVVDGRTYDLPSQSALIDTNLLVAYFDDREADHEKSSQFFALLDGAYFFPVIPMSVLVEAWGLLVGRNRNHYNGLKLLDWSLQPGTVAVVPDSPTDLPMIAQLVATHELDVVDAMLLQLAYDIQQKCEMPKPLPIASMDRRDFYRILGQVGIAIRIIDIETLDVDEFEPSASRRPSPSKGRPRRSHR